MRAMSDEWPLFLAMTHGGDFPHRIPLCDGPMSAGSAVSIPACFNVDVAYTISTIPITSAVSVRALTFRDGSRCHNDIVIFAA